MADDICRLGGYFSPGISLFVYLEQDFVNRGVTCYLADNSVEKFLFTRLDMRVTSKAELNIDLGDSAFKKFLKNFKIVYAYFKSYSDAINNYKYITPPLLEIIFPRKDYKMQKIPSGLSKHDLDRLTFLGLEGIGLPMCWRVRS